MKRRLLTGIFLSFLFCMPVSASVSFTEKPTGGTSDIYVAGNPDLYPVEYYNPRTDRYEGIIPDALEMISEETGLSFTYVSSGEKDQRLRMAQNLQVDMVTALETEKLDLEEYSLSEAIPVLTYTEDETLHTVSIAFTEIAPEETRETVRQALSHISDAELTQITVSYIRAADRSVIPLWTAAAAAGIILAAVLAICILSVRLRRLKKASHTDQMSDLITGIGNKQYFTYHFQASISDQSRAIYAVAFIGFDITRVNQYYGEEEAENQLRYAASELTRTAADTDIIARVSGGGFAAAHICTSEEEAGKWIEELLRRLNQYCDKFGKDYRPGFSAGIYMMNQGDRDCETVLYNAQQGYFYAVSNHLPYAVTNTELLRRENEKTQLKKHTVEALENHEFKAFLQYIVAASDGHIIGAETLSRWDHPQKGLLTPVRYIDLMENEGTIVELDFYIFSEACRQLEQWEEEGLNFFISCNFTRMTLDNPNFAERLIETARPFSFSRSRMVLEITEDVTERNPEKSYDNIRRCKEAGFSIALDDVGSGYSSFSDLRDYPIDIVKIDRSILTSAVTEKGAALLKSMISMIHSLGMKALCEGVESDAQYNMLKEMKCDYLQGYYFYRTVPADEARRYLTAVCRPEAVPEHDSGQ